MKISSILFCLSVLVSQQALALYGARPMSAGNFSSVLELHFEDELYSEYNGYFCTGVLVARDEVLTAGHCIGGMGREIYDDSIRVSHEPMAVKVKVGNTLIRARNIAFARIYFEEWGPSGADLAIIKLDTPVKRLRPLPLMKKSDLKVGTRLTLVARGAVAQTSLLSMENYPEASVLRMDGREAGPCRGDSGGAVLAKKSGTWALAGILIYEGEEKCERKTGMAYFPQANF